MIWRDEQWHLKSGFAAGGLPFVAILEPREHYRLDNLPAELTATLGPMIQRVANAIGRIDSVARTHFNRWGDGSEHFHLWFLARPLGMMQLRGAMIAAWDDMLPKVPADELAANARAGSRRSRGGRRRAGRPRAALIPEPLSVRSGGETLPAPGASFLPHSSGTQDPADCAQ